VAECDRAFLTLLWLVLPLVFFRSHARLGRIQIVLGVVWEEARSLPGGFSKNVVCVLPVTNTARSVTPRPPPDGYEVLHVVIRGSSAYDTCRQFEVLVQDGAMIRVSTAIRS